MAYFVSHIGVILGAAVFVSVCAFLWWYLMDRNARLKRERARARMEEARKKNSTVNRTNRTDSGEKPDAAK